MKTISLNCSDAELSAAVQKHVVGLLFHVSSDDHNLEDGAKVGKWPSRVQPYATDANAVLPLLEKAQGGFTTDFNKSEWQVNLCVHGPSSDWYDGYGPTFARAACFALLRANGITLADGASERGTTG